MIYHLRLMGILDKVLAHIFPMTRVAFVSAAAQAIRSYHCKPPLLVAATRGQADLAGLLLTHASTSYTAPDVAGKRPGDMPSPHPLPGPARGERGEALVLACFHRHYRCAEVILAGGMSRTELNSGRDKLGRTALHVTATDNEVRLVRLLLRNGASPAIYNDAGRQPLHDACAAGYAEVAQALVEGNAHPNALAREVRDCWRASSEDAGKTAYEIAASRGYNHVSAAITKTLENAAAAVAAASRQRNNQTDNDHVFGSQMALLFLGSTK